MATSYKLTITKTTQKRARNGERPAPEVLTVFQSDLHEKDISRVVNCVLNKPTLNLFEPNKDVNGG